MNKTFSISKLFALSILLISFKVGYCQTNNEDNQEEFYREIAKNLSEKIPDGATVFILPADVHNEAVTSHSDTITFFLKTDYDNYLSDILITELSINSNNRYSVIDRRYMNKALEELKFQLSDLVDLDKVQKLGKFIGANYFIAVSVYCRNIKHEYGIMWSDHIFKFNEVHLYKIIEIKSLKVINGYRCNRRIEKRFSYH